MGYYEQFFDAAKRDLPYQTDLEAIADIRALVDVCLNLMFYGRDAQSERLDMRGVVITSQEFELALQDWSDSIVHIHCRKEAVHASDMGYHYRTTAHERTQQTLTA